MISNHATSSAPPMKYDVFISYRTSISPDREAAEQLQAILESFPIPRELKARIVSPTMFRNRLVVCRDVTELTAGHDLDAAILEKLERSRWLIVVCSPDTKDSLYCKTEVKYFRSIHGASKILCLLIAGEPEHVIPPILDYGSNAKLTDLAADVRDDTAEAVIRRIHGRGVPESAQARFKLLAPILGCSTPDELVQRHKRAWRRVVVSSIAFASLLIGVVGCLLNEQRLNSMEKEALAELGKLNIQLSQSNEYPGFKVVVDPFKTRDTSDAAIKNVALQLSRIRAPISTFQLQDGELTSIAPLFDAGLLDLYEIDVSFCSQLRNVQSRKQLPYLKVLSLPSTAIDDQELLQLLANCPTELRLLSLSGTRISDQGFKAIGARLKRIDELKLNDTEITLEGIRYLQAVEVARLQVRDMKEPFCIDLAVSKALAAIKA